MAPHFWGALVQKCGALVQTLTLISILGALIPSILVALVPSILGALALSILGALDPSILGALVPSILGAFVPRTLTLALNFVTHFEAQLLEFLFVPHFL